MANSEHLAVLKQGIEGWNEWRKYNPRVLPDLSAPYCGRLRGFEHINFQGINLERANFQTQVLKERTLNRQTWAMQICGTSIWPCWLGNAFARGRMLGRWLEVNRQPSQNNLIRADFSGANLMELTFGETIFGDANLQMRTWTCRAEVLDYQTLLW
jgi:hypothetical protein